MARVLIIEDDEVTAREIATELSGHGMQVEWVGSGQDGLDRAATGRYDVITLDRMLPGLDGIEVIGRLRERGVQTPVLMISALSDVDDRIRGLRAGGDDYLTKPFAPDEMAARVEVLLRRHDTGQTRSQLKVADLELDLLSRTARRGEAELNLLPTEFRLLEFLMRHSGQVLTRMMLFETVWGLNFDPGTNLIDVHIGRLRRKVDPPGSEPLIHTVRGSGYRLGKHV